MINRLLYEKWSLCIFEPLFGGLGVTYAVHLRLIGKLVVDFLLVTIEFFARCYHFVTIDAFDRQTDILLMAILCLHSCSAVKMTQYKPQLDDT